MIQHFAIVRTQMHPTKCKDIFLVSLDLLADTEFPHQSNNDIEHAWYEQVYSIMEYFLNTREK